MELLGANGPDSSKCSWLEQMERIEANGTGWTMDLVEANGTDSSKWN